MMADEKKESQSVVVEDIKMPFMSMVAFMVKWAIAAIPAMIILVLIGSLLIALFNDIIK